MKRKSDPPEGPGLLYVALAAVAFVALLAYFFTKKKSPPGSKGQAEGSARNRISAGRHSKTASAALHKVAPPSAQKRASPPAPAKAQPASHEQGGFDISNPKASAVLSTLSEREREIAVFLLKSGGRAKRSQVQHKLLIPKTSLLRLLRSLERKNIIKLTPFGRNLLAEIDQSLFR
jgi:uncharacterized membrane protein